MGAIVTATNIAFGPAQNGETGILAPPHEVICLCGQGKSICHGSITSKAIPVRRSARIQGRILSDISEGDPGEEVQLPDTISQVKRPRGKGAARALLKRIEEEVIIVNPNIVTEQSGPLQKKNENYNNIIVAEGQPPRGSGPLLHSNSITIRKPQVLQISISITAHYPLTTSLEIFLHGFPRGV